MFKGRDFKRYAYTLPKTKLAVYDRTKYQSYQSVCVAICSCHGLLIIMQKDYGFNNESFIEMLDSIHEAVGKEKVYLMLDQASFHRNEDVKSYMSKLNITPIFNVSYHF